VFQLDNIQGLVAKDYYKGYFLLTPMDLKMVEKFDHLDLYEAKIVSERQVEVTLCAWTYPELFGRKGFQTQAKDNVIIAMDGARHDINTLRKEAKGSEKSCLTKRVNLIFPEGQSLSNEKVSAEEKDGLISLEMIEVDDVMYAGWSVARTDLKPSQKGEVDDLNEEPKSAAAKLIAKRRKAGTKKEGS